MARRSATVPMAITGLITAVALTAGVDWSDQPPWPPVVDTFAAAPTTVEPPRLGGPTTDTLDLTTTTSTSTPASTVSTTSTPATAPITTAPPTVTVDPAAEAIVAAAIADVRLELGLQALDQAADLDAYATAQAIRMAETGSLDHGPIDTLLDGWVAVGENIATAGDPNAAVGALLESPSHYQLIVEPSYEAAGIGAARDQAGQLWICHVFAATTLPTTTLPDILDTTLPTLPLPIPSLDRTMTGFHLLDHPNPNGQFFHPSRIACKHGIAPANLPHLIVVHTAESLPDYTEADTSGESLARYASTTARSVSWHATIDSDSTIPMLPDGYVGAHVIDYNRCSVGMEIATQAHRWVELSTSAPAWYAAIMGNAANQAAWWCRTHKIPAAYLTKAQVDAGGRGITSHARLDPDRRSDPGAAFAWTRFVADIASRLIGPTGYVDRPEWPVWAVPAIEKAIAKKIMVADGIRWTPNIEITRAELAVILDRLGLLG